MAELSETQVRAIVEAEFVRRRQTENLPAKWKLEALGYMGGILVGLAAIAALGLNDWVASIVEAKAQEIVSGKSEKGFVELREAVVGSLGSLPSFRDDVAGRVLPNNALVIVSHEDGCPDGWFQDEDSKGRFIVGVGGQKGLTAKVFGQRDGAETHTLTIPELPPHDHGGRTGPNHIETWSNQWGEGQTNPIPSGKEGFRSDQKHNHVIKVTGGGLPHNNMPPYIALYFCKKKRNDPRAEN